MLQVYTNKFVPETTSVRFGLPFSQTDEKIGLSKEAIGCLPDAPSPPLDERDFTLVNPARVQTNYPLQFLRNFAAKFAETSLQKKRADVLDRIGRLGDAELDIEFVSLLAPLYTELHLNENELSVLYFQLMQETPNNPYLEKFFTLCKEENSTFPTLSVQLTGLKEEIAELISAMRKSAHEILESRKQIHAMGQMDEVRAQVVLLGLGDAKKAYLQMENRYRERIAQLILTVELAGHFRNQCEQFAETGKWQIVGMAVATIASLMLFPQSVLPLCLLFFVGNVGGAKAKECKDELQMKFLKDRGPQKQEGYAIQIPDSGVVASYSYYSRSTGLWGALLGKESRTAGTLSIHGKGLGVEYPFQIENGRSPLGYLRQIEMCNSMIRATQAGVVVPSKCLDFLHALEQTPLPLRENGEAPTFMTSNDILTFFTPILCRYLIWDSDALTR